MTHNLTEQALVRICEFIDSARDRGDANVAWMNRVSYLAHATLDSFRRSEADHSRLAKVARSPIEEAE